MDRLIAFEKTAKHHNSGYRIVELKTPKPAPANTATCKTCKFLGKTGFCGVKAAYKKHKNKSCVSYKIASK